MNFIKGVPDSNFENQKFYIGKYHVSKLTKIISIFFFFGHVVFGICFRCLDIAYIAPLYFTPFFGINKFQPWALIPLFILIVLDLFFPSIVLVNFAFYSHNYTYNICIMLLIVPILNCISGFYFYVTIRYWKYIKEMKLIQQKQKNNIEEEIGF